MDTKTTDRVWDAIVDGLSVDGDFDHDGAVKVADQVKRELTANAEWNLERMRKAKSDNRSRTLKTVGGWVLAILVLAAITVGILAIVKYAHHAKHFAHYKRSAVPTAASDAIYAYYGQNDLPSNLSLVYARKDSLFGRPAWKVLYKNPNNKVVCVYLWKVSVEANGDLFPRSRVEHGVSCGV